MACASLNGGVEGGARNPSPNRKGKNSLRSGDSKGAGRKDNEGTSEGTENMEKRIPLKALGLSLLKAKEVSSLQISLYGLRAHIQHMKDHALMQ